MPIARCVALRVIIYSFDARINPCRFRLFLYDDTVAVDRQYLDASPGVNECPFRHYVYQLLAKPSAATGPERRLRDTRLRHQLD